MPPRPPGPLPPSADALLNADSSDDALPLLAPVLPTADEPDVPLDVTAGSEKPALVPLVLLAPLPLYAISQGVLSVASVYTAPRLVIPRSSFWESANGQACGGASASAIAAPSLDSKEVPAKVQNC